MDLLMEWIGPHNWWLAFCVLFAAGLFEYLFPPVPGDTTMLFGFFLVGRGDLPLWLAFGAAFAGSTAGALLAYRIGYRLGGRYFFLRSSARTGSMRARLDGWFNRYGARVVVVNRFLPGVRAFFLFLAGMRRLPLGQVLLYSTLSNLGLLLMFAFVGTRLGSVWENVERGFKAAFLGLGVLFLAGLLTWLVLFVRQRRESAAGAQA
jgi:membrane-associated protein